MSSKTKLVSATTQPLPSVIYTDWSKCIICQEEDSENLCCPAHSSDGVGDGYVSLAEDLIAFSAAGCLPEGLEISKLDYGDGVAATFQRHSAKFHTLCRILYSKSRLKRTLKRKRSETHLITEKQLKCELDTQDHNVGKTTVVCLFCDKPASSSEPLFAAMTKVIGNNENRSTSTTKLVDKKFLEKPPSLGDSIGGEAKYHAKCLVAIYSATAGVKANRKLKNKVQTQEGQCSRVFVELVAFIEDTLATREEQTSSPVFKLSDLVGLYNDRLAQLGVACPSVHATRLMDRVLARFPELEVYEDGCDIFFIRSKDFDMQLWKAYGCDSESDAFTLAQAARIVRKEMMDTKPNFTDNIPENGEAVVPPSLITLVAMLLYGANITEQLLMTKTQALLSICQLLLYNSSYRSEKQTQTSQVKSCEPVLPLYLGILLHKNTQKRDLVKKFFDLGLSVSYDRVLEISTEKRAKICSYYEKLNSLQVPQLKKSKFVTSALKSITQQTETKSSLDKADISVLHCCDDTSQTTLPETVITLKESSETSIATSLSKKTVQRASDLSHPPCTTLPSVPYSSLHRRITTTTTSSTANMDLYLPSTEPGLTLQEMIDCDIKCGLEFSEGLDSVITSSDLNSLDLSGMSSLEAELDLKSFEPLFDPLEVKLEDMDVGEEHTEEMNVVNSWMNMSSMSNYSLDLENSIMVNPSAVLPTTLPLRTTRHNELITSASSTTPTSATLFIKTEPQPATTTTSVQTPQSHASNGTVTTQVTVVRPQGSGQSTRQHNPVVSVQSSHSPSQNNVVTRPTLASQMVVQTTQRTPSQQLTLASSTLTTNTTPTTTPIITARTTTPHTILSNRYKNTGKPRKDIRPEEKMFPKPAYSYSCLIALALKNSTTGSLPVSEIYSFMCEHFPYFRTAPNGWKNSVRHNLSLNKCFEKIEKPVGAGSNQRKGCLWALNPAKAHKMDEEVQKWSKKDLQGIKDAMTYPEVLEALERGEMKFESNGGVSSCSEDEDEDEDVDPLSIDTPATPTLGTVKILNPVTSATIVTSRERGGNGGLTSQAVRAAALQNGRTPMSPSQAQSRTTYTTTHPLKRATSISDEPEFILPDSTMTEISLQSNGALVDDLGNEIKIEGEAGVGNNSSPRGLVVRKLPGVTPLRSATVRANYVYTPSISSPHQQHTLNRLVLTNVLTQAEHQS
ncbi:hypothetical protein Pmani_023027 [Petrolisthes manimaculis]|uniref:Fork-head domain-containing protein n=1 Tax=Petrolisthes manimaculis TaxID=1843537 RepID=A0AAE1PDA4_9EUCA|nr:hypothetical protein Pmani_023027 [Petrolisthes manimaculis]